ncbi:unnamed protein product [Leptidea sinapis]|uniref:Uncharacterized protein n=1 Tax=Leptidea sinapis TaxID=189913 RepID=A0A5E4QEX9_9NEOP|nr:unnamed protein product [Leptidea sinapis]
MDGCHAVDSVGADHAKVRHIHSLLAFFFDERHATETVEVSRPPLLHFFEISMCRGRTFSNIEQGHLSNASGRTVWFVYAQHFTTRFQASSYGTFSMSINMRRSSGIANAGWGGSAHEVFLSEPQLFSFKEIVVGIEHTRYVLCDVTVQHGLNVNLLKHNRNNNIRLTGMYLPDITIWCPSGMPCDKEAIMLGRQMGSVSATGQLTNSLVGT